MAQTEASARSFLDGSYHIPGDAGSNGKRDRSQLFRRLQKRDGSIVDFDKTKISDAIFKAAQSVGGRDRRLSEMLADRVILHLANTFEGNLLNVEDLQDAVEKVLIENGHARTVTAYIVYRRERARVRKLQQGHLEADDLRDTRSADAVHADVQVETSSERVVRWDRNRIVNALVRETGLSRRVARKIAGEIENQIIFAKIKRVTASLIRELVNAKLVEYGFEEERRLHARLGVPRYDAERLMLADDPTVSRLTPAEAEVDLAGSIGRQFSANRIFTQEVIESHLRGDLHLHNLQQPGRLGSSVMSPEYVKKFGPLGDDSPRGVMAPESFEELMEGLISTLTTLSAHGNGHIGLDAVNVFLAPYCVGLDTQTVDKMANHLIHRFATESTRPGLPGFHVDLHLTGEVPTRLVQVMATAEGGRSTGEAYGYYEREARALTAALLDAATKRAETFGPLATIRTVFHVTHETLTSPNASPLLERACEVAARWGAPVFTFERDNEARLTPYGTWTSEQAEFLPWKLRGTVAQTVTLNLARAALIADGDEQKVLDHLSDSLTLAIKAHLSKKSFLDRLIAKGEEGPYRMLLSRRDGETFLRTSRIRYGIGLVGMEEMARGFTGKSPSESPESLKFVLKILAHLNLECRRYAERDGLQYSLTASPGLAAASRLATLDVERFQGHAGGLFSASGEDLPIVYTQGLPSRESEEQPLLLSKREGKYHDLVDGEADTDFVLHGESTSASLLQGLIEQTFRTTRNVQITWSPEWTACRDCGALDTGLKEVCDSCHSSKVRKMIRVDGHYQGYDRRVPLRAAQPASGEWMA